jgi:serine protease inhibitor
MKKIIMLGLLLVVVVLMSGCTAVQKADDSGTTAEGVKSVDHPFMFIIQERSTENILFLGRVNDPR